MEIFLNILPQHFIRTEIRGIIKHIQTFGAGSKSICNIKNCYCHCDCFRTIIFTAIMILETTYQPMQYWREKTRKVWRIKMAGNGLANKFH